MKNKSKNILQIISIVGTFSLIWVIGVLIYGEIVLADTLSFGSILGKEYENLFALTPIFILLAGLIFTLIAKKKKSKSIFVTTETMLLLPFVSYLLGALLMATNSFLGILGYIFFLPGAPAFTCLGCLNSVFDNPYISIVLIPVLYAVISVSYIFIYKYKNKH